MGMNAFSTSASCEDDDCAPRCVGPTVGHVRGTHHLNAGSEKMSLITSHNVLRYTVTSLDAQNPKPSQRGIAGRLEKAEEALQHDLALLFLTYLAVQK